MENSMLIPCPFCGGTNLRIKGQCAPARLGRHAGIKTEYHTYFVQCNNCGAKSGEFGGHVIPNFRLYCMAKMPIWATTREVLRSMAIEAWNRRADNG